MTTVQCAQVHQRVIKKQITAYLSNLQRSNTLLNQVALPELCLVARPQFILLIMGVPTLIKMYISILIISIVVLVTVTPSGKLTHHLVALADFFPNNDCYILRIHFPFIFPPNSETLGSTNIIMIAIYSCLTNVCIEQSCNSDCLYRDNYRRITLCAHYSYK